MRLGKQNPAACGGSINYLAYRSWKRTADTIAVIRARPIGYLDADSGVVHYYGNETRMDNVQSLPRDSD